MTKDEANAVLKMTADQLVNYDLVDSAFVPNMKTQYDAAMSQIDDLNDNLVAAAADKTAAVQVVQDQLAELQSAFGMERASMQGQAVDLTAQLKVATDQVAALQVYDAQYQAGQKQLAIDAANAQLNDAVDKLSQLGAPIPTPPQPVPPTPLPVTQAKRK